MVLGVIQQLRGQEGGRGVSKKSTLVHPGGGGLWMSTWTKIWKKGIEESWQMTMKSLITSPFVQLWLEDAVHRRWLKTKACVFLCAKSSVIGDKVDIKLHYIELNWIFYGGGFFCPFCPRGQGGGYVECPRLSTRGGEGVKIGSKLVHVVVECPLCLRTDFLTGPHDDDANDVVSWIPFLFSNMILS